MTAALILLERDLRAVARARSQLYSSIITPLIFLVFLGAGVTHGLQPANLPAGNFTAFLVPGVVVMTLVFSATFSSASYYRDRDNGVLRVLLASPHSPRRILLGKSLAGVVIGVVQASIVLAIAAPFVDFRWQYGVPAGLAVAVLVMVLTALLLAGVAQVFASRIQSMQGFHLVMNLVLFPLLFFSGAFFPIADVPTWLEVLARVNPLTYAVDALQVAVYAEDTSGFTGLPIDLAVLGVLAAAVFALSFARVPRVTWSGM
jgi:ABC-2 type transport system permease protein